jgi:hypothetical protein
METAVECLEKKFQSLGFDFEHILEQAKEMEKKQLFLASKTSAKEAYKAGQQTMHCGCYEISDALTYEEWLYETFKSE